MGREARLLLDDQDVYARGQDRKPPLSLSSVVARCSPPICAGEATVTVAAATVPPCSSLTNPLSEPVKPCPSAGIG